MADPVPPQVATAARSLDLGEPHGVYPGPANLLYALLWWGYGTIVGSIGIACLSPGAGVAGNGSAWGKTVTVLIGVVALICALAMAWRGVQIIRNRKLYLYIGGIIYTHPSGRAKWCASWQDAQVYWGDGSKRNFENYRVVFPQGGRVKWGVGVLGDQEYRARMVGPQMRRLSTAWKLPVALGRFRSGEAVEFGPLTVDARGVALIDKAKTLPWSQVTSVALRGRIALIITGTEKRRISVPLKRIPDLNVLLKVIEVARGS